MARLRYKISFFILVTMHGCICARYGLGGEWPCGREPLDPEVAARIRRVLAETEPQHITRISQTVERGVGPELLADDSVLVDGIPLAYSNVCFDGRGFAKRGRFRRLVTVLLAFMRLRVS